ncbi:hypothetical protein I3843_01G190700 [Carya illinoinensis]|nr:hypothetical protein I3843_01G190700 [Carya illinoinensis]
MTSSPQILSRKWSVTSGDSGVSHAPHLKRGDQSDMEDLMP